MIIDPDKYLREAYINALAPLGVPIWEGGVPLDAVIPEYYILIGGHVNSRKLVNKITWEWNCSLTLDVHRNNPLGFSDSAGADDMVGAALSAIEAGISASGFRVKTTQLQDTVRQDFDTVTHSVNRRLVRYLHWLSRRET